MSGVAGPAPRVCVSGHPQDGIDGHRDGLPSYAQIAPRGIPAIKHTKYTEFQRFLQPFLAAKGFPRNSYEVVCVFREPIDWLFSLWRYRSREVGGLLEPEASSLQWSCSPSSSSPARTWRGPAAETARRSSARRSLCERAAGRPGWIVSSATTPYDLLVDFLCKKVGKEVEVGTKNVSPERVSSLSSLSEGCEHELREFFRA